MKFRDLSTVSIKCCAGMTTNIKRPLKTYRVAEFQRNYGSLHWQVFQEACFATLCCKRNIEMTPLCKIEVTPPRVLGSREVRRGGGVDEQAGVQSSSSAIAGSVGS